MERIQPQFIGVELYFDNLEMAKRFYVETLGLEVSEETHQVRTSKCQVRRSVQDSCVWSGKLRGTVAIDPSKDKADISFIEVPDLGSAIAAIGQDRVVQSERTWAVLHDPEDHNILLLQRSH